MSRQAEYDVIVIGAGPAGTSTAACCARQGLRVMLLDKACFPRDKTCGDALGSLCLAVLDELGVRAKLERLNPWHIDHILLSSPDGSVMRGRIPCRNDGLRDYGYIVPRKDLDALLLEHACSFSEVRFMDTFKVTRLIRNNDRWMGVAGQHKKKAKKVTGKIIVAADGVHSVIARQLGLLNEEARHRSLAVRAYFENVEGLEHTAELHYEKAILPGYAWLFPCGPQKANIGVGVGTRFTSAKGLREKFETFLKKNASAKEKLIHAKMVEGSFKGWPITFGSFPGKRAVENVLLTGDAASFVDTLTGEGIYYALRSGQRAAQAITVGLSRAGDRAQVGEIYEQLWAKDFKYKEFIPGFHLQLLLNQPGLVNLMVKYAARKQAQADRLAGVIWHRTPKLRIIY